MKAVDFPAGIGAALGGELTRQGIGWATINGVLHVSDEPAFQAVAGVFDQAAGERPAKIAEVKAEAARRIEAIAPFFKQINLLRAGKANDPMFAKLDALRVASDQIEAKIAATSTAAEVIEFDPAKAPEWPE